MQMSAESRDLLIQVRGVDLELLPERLLYLPDRSTLVAADLHLGKSAALGQVLPSVPDRIPGDDLGRLSMAIERKKAARLLILGDMIHSRSGRHQHVFRELIQWRQRHPEIGISLIRGNHDRHAGDPPSTLGCRCLDGPLLDAPFLFAHEPFQSQGGYVVAGHLHPAVRLRGPGRHSERAFCFLFGELSAVLPSFGTLTGAKTVNPDPSSRVFVIAGDRVVEVPLARRRKNLA